MDNIENELIPEENTEAEISEEALDEEDAASEYNDLACHVEKIENELAEANDNYRRLFAELITTAKEQLKKKAKHSQTQL
jgi:nitrate reductase assembly molybdenum cofactor insertion protein NarJ